MSLEHSETSSAGPRSPSTTDDSQIRSLSIDILDGDHHDLFTRAITRILFTEVAELAYAQIIDGLPLTRVIYESRGGKLPKGHPLHSAHQELCPGMLDKVRQFREEFAPEILSIDSRVSWKLPRVVFLLGELTFLLDSCSLRTKLPLRGRGHSISDSLS